MKKTSIVNHSVKLLVLIGTIALLLSSCAKRIQAVGPPETYQKVIPPKTLSTLSVPINIPIPALQRSVNEQTKGTLYRINDLSYAKVDRLSMKVWKEAPILIRGYQKDQFEITVPLKTWLKGGVDTEVLGLRIKRSISTNLGIRVKFLTKIGLDRNWRVNTQTRILNYKWTKAPAIKLGPIRIPLKFLANKLIDTQLDYISKTIDTEIKKQVNLRQMLSGVWNQVQAPFLVSEEYKTWVRIEPTALLMTPISTRRQTLSTTVGMRGYAAAFVGNKPASGRRKLPKLTIKQTLNNRFKVYLQSKISKEYALQVAKQNFLNKTYRNGKRKVKIVGLNLYGSGEKIVVQAQLEGSLTGTIFLSGTPAYDPKQQTIVINDLNFNLDTRNKLIKVANWLFHRKFIRKIKEAIQLPMKSTLADTKKEAQKMLKNYQVTDGVTLRGTLDDLHIDKIVMTPNSIITWILASGKMNVDVKKF